MKYANHIALLERIRVTLPRTLKQAEEDNHNICAHLWNAYIELRRDESPSTRRYQAWADAHYEVAIFIRDLLGGHELLEEWLAERQLVSRKVSEHVLGGHIDQINSRTFAKLQRTRLAWVDWMIEHYTALGA